MIWEPFAMALVLGLAMSAGLYFAYLWPSVEPDDDDDTDLVADEPTAANKATAVDTPVVADADQKPTAVTEASAADKPSGADDKKPAAAAAVTDDKPGDA